MTTYGIDLGTTFTSIATVIPSDGVARTQVINITDDDKDTLESVVRVTQSDGRLRARVGSQAHEFYGDDEDARSRMFRATKRDIGMQGSGWPIEVGGRGFTPEAVASLILRKVKQEVSAQQPTPVERVVITHPHYFTEPQKAATREAGRFARLDVIETLNEPTAAALAYGVLDQGAEGHYLVFDLGGGTFDVTLMEFSGGRIRVLRGDGDSRLGGIDWDNAILKHFDQKFAEKYPEFDLNGPHTPMLVREEWRRKAVEAKLRLSRDSVYRARLEATFSDGSTGRQTVDVSRDVVEELTRDLVTRCRVLADRVLDGGGQGPGMKWSDLREVLLVGGSTKLPAVRRAVREAMGREPKVDGFNPNTLVAQGAAFFAARFEEDAALRRAVAAESEGAASRPATPPRPKKSGLALPALQDAVARGIGIGVFDERGEYVVDGLVPKSTSTPHKAVRRYFTQENNQQEIRATLYEGESNDPDLCVAMGECVLRDLPPGPAGQPVEVTFDIATSGRATVYVKHLLSGRQIEQAIERGRPGGSSRKGSGSVERDPLEWLWSDVDVD